MNEEKIINLPERDDEIYKEIERFKDYELMECVVYEMAIRNKTVRTLRNKIKQKIKSIRAKIKKRVECLESELRISEQEIQERIKKGDKKLQSIIEEHHYYVSLLFSYSSKNEEYIKTYSEFQEIEKLIEELINEYYFREIYKEDVSRYVFNNKNKTFIEYKTIQTSTCNVKIPIIKKPFFPEKYLMESRIINNKDCIFFTGTTTKKETFVRQEGKIINFNKIFPFRIKRLVVPKKKDRTINLNINLSLPKNEIISYISKIKDEYDNDNSIIKSYIDLLSENLNLEHINIKNMTSKGWADMFYMYDFFNISKDPITDKYNDLIENLTVYNGYKIEKPKKEQKKGEPKSKIVSYSAYKNLISQNPKFYDNKTVKKFYSLSTIKSSLKLMKSLIDDMNYKNLIN